MVVGTAALVRMPCRVCACRQLCCVDTCTPTSLSHCPCCCSRWNTLCANPFHGVSQSKSRSRAWLGGECPWALTELQQLTNDDDADAHTARTRYAWPLRQPEFLADGRTAGACARGAACYRYGPRQECTRSRLVRVILSRCLSLWLDAVAQMTTTCPRFSLRCLALSPSRASF